MEENEENNLVIYARMYRKGRKKELIEVSSLLELHHRQQSLEPGEELKVLHGLDKWWHVNVRLGWKNLSRWVREWTLDRTYKLAGIVVAITVLIVFVEKRATNHDEVKDTHTPPRKTKSSNEATLEEKPQPLLLSDSVRKDTVGKKK